MGTQVSLFMSKITRTKTEDEDGDGGIDFFRHSRNLQLSSSVKMLTGACFNCAIFIVVGLSVKSIAGSAMVFSVILGTAVAMLNTLPMAELCTSFKSITSYYEIIYKNVGELCAFMVGWLRLLQSIFMIAVVSVGAGEHIRYLLKPVIGSSWLPSHTSPWIEVRVDDLVFIAAFLAIISLTIAAGLPRFSAYITALFWTNIAAFLFMFVLVIYYARSFNWSHYSTKFELPYDFYAMTQGVAISVFFFTRLDKVVEQGVYIKSGSINILPISLALSLLTIALFYLCSTLFVGLVAPLDMVSEEATLPKLFFLTTFHSSKYILAAAAIIVFCLTLIESYFDAQKLFNLMAEDGLVHYDFSNPQQIRNWKRVPAISVFITGILAMPLFIWLPLDKLIEGFCIVSLMISIVINCTAIIVQYRPLTQYNDEKNSALPNWQSTKYCIIRLLLCFGYITHERVLAILGVTPKTKATQQSSKVVNWTVLWYVPSCVGLSLAMFHGLPVLGWKWWLMLGAFGLLCITLFFTLRIILIQPRPIANVSLFGSNFLSSFVPLLNIGLLCILLVSFEWMAFSAVGVWLFLGLFLYFLYGISNSEEALFDKSQELNTNVPLGRVRFDSPPQLETTFRSVQPENVNSEQFLLFSDDTKQSYYPQGNK